MGTPGRGRLVGNVGIREYIQRASHAVEFPTMKNTNIETIEKTRDSAWFVFLIFLRLGLTSFGGPVAHLGYFRTEFVARRHWLSERSYADLVALCQFLPGPASSQVGIALGLTRAGYAGALAAWTGFTLPSAILLAALGMGLANWGGHVPMGLLQGLKIVAVAVVAQAVWGMARKLCFGAVRLTMMLISACVVIEWPNVFGQVGVILIAAMIGMLLFKPGQKMTHDPLPIQIKRRTGALLLIVFFALLIGLPIMSEVAPNRTLAVSNAFYRAGSLVFGGGHVVLPLLQASVVPNDWVSNDTFLAGYGAAQAVPGPLFTYAAFLGAAMNSAPNGWLGAIICLLSIFVPSFLLVFGTLPFWEQLRRSKHTQAALSGVNAAVVGLLLAALYNPVWTSAIHKPADFWFLALALIALIYWKLPPWLVVLISGVAGWVLASIF
jgi:chromate transporter